MSNQHEEEKMMQILNQEGCIIKQQFSYFKGRVKLEPEVLGLDPKEINTKVLSLGHLAVLGEENQKRLDVFKNLASELSSYIVKNSFEMFGAFRFTPNSKLAGVNEKRNDVTARANRALLQLIADWPGLVADAREFWTVELGPLFETDQQVDRAVDKIMANCPTSIELKKKFKFSCNAISINVPDIDFQMELTSVRDREHIADARKQMVQEEARKLAEESTEFVSNCLAELRSGLVRCVEEMRDSMSSDKSKVNQKALNKLRNRFDEIRSMNFINDNSLNDLIDRFEGEFLGTTAGEYRSSDAALEALRHGVDQLTNSAKELAESDGEDVIATFGSVGRRRIRIEEEESAA